jgi:Rrf2 family protein
MSTRFTVSSHILAALEINAGAPVCSSKLASSANTSAAVVRQLLSRLSTAGLVHAQLGAGGGSYLARPAQEISLLDVHDAVEVGPLFCAHRDGPSCECPVGRHVLGALDETLRRAEAAMRAELKRTTIADVAEDIRARSRAEGIIL